MEVSSICDRTERHLALLQEIYPDIAFAYMFRKDKKAEPLDEPVDLDQWVSELDIDRIEILYLYGIEEGIYYKGLLSWLKQKKERVLVILESSIDQLTAFLASREAEPLLLDPQVRLRLVPGNQAWEYVLKECCIAFPSEKVDLVASRRYQKKYRKKVEKLKLSLYRKATLFYSLLCESLQYHFLMDNLLPNMGHIAQSCYVNQLKGVFQNVPAIICGAGPSLDSVKQDLQQLENHALIFAGGSAISALTSQGVRPHIALALDPNDEEYLRVKTAQAFDIPLFFAPRLKTQVLNLLSSPLGYMSTGTGGGYESWMEERLGLRLPRLGRDLSCEALSVTTLIVSLAQHMGCSPIIFCGVDLAYTDKKRYAEGVMVSSRVDIPTLQKVQDASNKIVVKKDRHGKKIYSLVRWVMEAEVLGQYAKDHPHIPFFNAAPAGLPIPGIEYQDFSLLARELRTNHLDLHGMLHAAMEEAALAPAETVDSLNTELHDSLKRVIGYITSIVQEIAHLEECIADLSYPLLSAKRVLLDMDLQEELAYAVLLQTAPDSIEKLFLRGFWTNAVEDSLEYRRCFVNKQKIKYRHLLEIASHYSKVFSKY